MNHELSVPDNFLINRRFRAGLNRSRLGTEMGPPKDLRPNHEPQPDHEPQTASHQWLLEDGTLRLD